MAKEKADLTELYQTLEENFSRYLGVSPMSQTVHILLYMESYEYTQSPQRKSELKDMLDCERVFLNTLEAIRKPVYDLIHRGVKVVITWQEDSGDYDNDRGCECEEDGKTHETPMQNLFHLSKEEWEQEKAEDMGVHDEWNPLKHYKEKGMIRDSLMGHYSGGFTYSLPDFRKRWQYRSFGKLIRIEMLDLFDSDEESGVCPWSSEEDGDGDDSDDGNEKSEEDDDDDEEGDSEEEGYDSDDGYWDSDIEGEQGGYEATYDDLQRWGVA
ncbi:hypothetical protein J4E86_008893 [Alternaria arbusti]|uniref:uncharacterized protein n=1 Tax=Alternaria arbusti TaxID=232088 RepID=UPI00221E7A19|nr:uncharacterized protein J4E86_008893 [Alternaria arbusti]KAI4946190.1 hypothetical protein J4E86_008893 [Alternaria arbusti]